MASNLPTRPQQSYSRLLKLALAGSLGAVSGYVLTQLLWVHRYLAQQNVNRTLTTPQNHLHTGLTYSASREAPTYQISHTIENGIERITYTPAQRRYQTPILFQHGMWHGAWCWRWWQALFAEWGWESTAISLPGHGQSPVQRPIPLCTLDYYLAFLKAEVQRMPQKPVLIGHSMGGALVQWYLKYVGDDLPAAVLAAPWPHRVTVQDSSMFWRNDPLGFLMILLYWSATPFVRSPRSAARLLISDQALLTPQELHARLGPESTLVLMQYISWQAPQRLHTPLLIVAAEEDTMLSVNRLVASAMHYQADFYIARRAGHNLQMDQNFA
ncbi:MAG: alpha/beta hydrolase, partial [Anaerolineales bacterium]|nr:alpha/beta hydrolase [Anaerolineales bacterium]